MRVAACASTTSRTASMTSTNAAAKTNDGTRPAVGRLMPTARKKMTNTSSESGEAAQHVAHGVEAPLPVREGADHRHHRGIGRHDARQARAEHVGRKHDDGDQGEGGQHARGNIPPRQLGGDGRSTRTRQQQVGDDETGGRRSRSSRQRERHVPDRESARCERRGGSSEACRPSREGGHGPVRQHEGGNADDAQLDASAGPDRELLTLVEGQEEQHGAGHPRHAQEQSADRRTPPARSQRHGSHEEGRHRDLEEEEHRKGDSNLPDGKRH